jgi:hypothetical protein
MRRAHPIQNRATTRSTETLAERAFVDGRTFAYSAFVITPVAA